MNLVEEHYINHYDVIIGIIAHTNHGLLQPCIESIQKNTSKNFKIRIILNNPSAGISIHSMEKFQNIEFIKNDEPQGFAKNFNLLLPKAILEAPYFIMLNDDTLFINDVVDKVLSIMEINKRIAASSPQLYYENGDPQLSGGFFTIPKEIWRISGLSRFLPTRLKTLIGEKVKHQNILGEKLSIYLRNFVSTSIPWKADYVSGTCMFLRSSAVKDVGLLDENFFMYAEDVDWCQRAKRHSWDIMVVPDAKVVHYENKSTNLKVRLEKEKSTLFYFQKHSSRLSYSIYKTFAILIFSIHYVSRLILGESSTKKSQNSEFYKDILWFLLQSRNHRKT